VWAVGFSGSRPLILHYDGAGWRRVASPALGARGILADVTAVSPRDAWAAGQAGSKVLIEHWDGTAWTRVPSPRAGGFLAGIAAASARDVWAVGAGTGTLVLRWDGTAWHRVPAPSPSGAMLYRVTVIAAADAWAAGTSDRGALILHWDGTAWRRIRSPAGRGTALVGVSGTSARSAWAVGATGGLLAAAADRAGPGAPVTGTPRPDRGASAAPAAEPLILHWDGNAWRRVSSPEPAPGGQLIGVYARSGRSAWAVGCTRTFASAKARPLVLRWNGVKWT
jgi:hypothetical protein